MFENAFEIVFLKNLNIFKVNFFMLPNRFDMSCQKYFLKKFILMHFRTKNTFKISTTLMQLRQCLETLLKLCFLKKLIFLYFQIVLICWCQKYLKKTIILIHFQIKNTLNQNRYLDSGCPRFQKKLFKIKFFLYF